MIIRYTLEQQDLMALCLFNFKHSPILRRQQRLGVLMFAGMMMGGFLLVTGKPYGWHWHPAMLLGILGIVAVATLAYRSDMQGRYLRRSRRHYEKEGAAAFGTSVTVRIGPEGVETEVPTSTTLFRWNAIERVAATDEHVFLYLGALRGIVVPTRAFADPAQHAEFLELVKQYHSPASHGAQVSGLPQGQTST